MALVRILVDGYSLLHNWTELAPGKPRHSQAARDELIHVLTLYQDACGTPVTVIFDGAGSKRGRPGPDAQPPVEVLYSRTGQTADQMIERATHRFQEYGEVLVVTDDFAERDTVISLGGMVASCLGFIQSIESALADLQRELKNYNRREQRRFKNGR
jgi:predicted RNA-binding protein with PIN domain